MTATKLERFETTVKVGLDHFKKKDVEKQVFFTVEGKAYTAIVKVDDWYRAREDDPLWTWVTTDRAGYSDTDPYSGRSYDIDQFEVPEKSLVENLYLYRHSGDSISRGNFSCGWDSGKMGYAFVEKERIRKWYGVKRVTKKIREKAYKQLDWEVEEMNLWNSGQIYELRIESIDGGDFHENVGAIVTTEDMAEVLCIHFGRENFDFFKALLD